MVYGMSRDTLQAVTLPLLVDAVSLDDEEPGCAEGECAVFTSRGGMRLQKVRRVDPRRLARHLTGDTGPGLARALKGLGLLRRAYEARDTWALLKAIEQVRPLLPKPPFGKLTEDWSGEKIWGGAQWLYSEAMSHVTKNARWVTWVPFSGEHIARPGIYCPDASTAVAITLFFQKMRVCPHCGAPFVPEPDNAEYCSPAHGVAYRTARSREKKRRERESKA